MLVDDKVEIYLCMFSYIFFLYMPCVFEMHLPKFMEARSLLYRGQNASDLVFPPLGIHLSKAEIGKGKVG